MVHNIRAIESRNAYVVKLKVFIQTYPLLGGVLLRELSLTPQATPEAERQ
jgi:hypothetical protein